MKKNTVFITLLIALIFGMALVSCFVTGCSSSDDDESIFASPSPSPSEQPKLLFVSTRNNNGATDIFEGDLDFTNKALTNVKQVTVSLGAAMWNDPYMCFACNKLFGTMTQGSFLYNDIRSVDYSTGDMTTLTDSAERNNLYPVVTDDYKVVYISEIRDSNTYEIRQMNTDGSNNTLLTTVNGYASSLAKGENGNSFLVTVSDSNQNTDIYKYDRSVNTWTRLTNTSDTHEYGARYTSSGKIIFIAEGSVQGWSDVYRMDVDGSNVTRVTNSEMDYSGPVWQYDRYIIFQSGEDVWYYDTTTSENINLTNSNGSNYSQSVFVQ